jgi:hypothetical protein
MLADRNADVVRRVALIAGSVSVRIPTGWLRPGEYVVLRRRGARVVVEPVRLVPGPGRD